MRFNAFATEIGNSEKVARSTSEPKGPLVYGIPLEGSNKGKRASKWNFSAASAWGGLLLGTPGWIASLLEIDLQMP